MLKHNCTTKGYIFFSAFIFSALLLNSLVYGQPADKSKDPIVITSNSLVADKKKSLIVFKGSVVAKTKDMIINSDTMEVTYTSDNKIDTITAKGNVVVESGDGKIYSEKAKYLSKGEKVIFTGNPKAIDGDNVITGNKITYYVKDEKVEVEGSKVFLKENVDSIAQPGN